MTIVKNHHLTDIMILVCYCLSLMIGEVKIVLISGLVLELGMIETVKLIRIMTLSNLINEV